MKPTSLVLLFTATALAAPQAMISSAAAANSTTPSAIPSLSSPPIAPTASLPSTKTSKAAAVASPSSPSSILSNLNSAACKRVIAANASTLAHIAKLKSEGLNVPPYLSGYLIAAKAAEVELGCSTSAST